MKNIPERLIAVTNPAGTRRKLAESALSRLHTVFGNRFVERHTYPSPKHTTEMLKETLREGDIVATIGGDGTARTAVEALADPTIPAHEAILLPLPYGFQNDLARQLHGSARSNDPAKIIYGSSVIDITPMQVTLEGEESVEYLSALYAGIGLMAHAAYFQESEEYRSHWLYRTAATRDLYSMRLFPWVMRHAQPFHATVDGVERELTDVTVAKIPVLAKYLHPPVNFLEDEACYMEIQQKSLREIGAYVGRLIAQPRVSPPAHEILRGANNTKSLTVLDDTFLHTDGDARAVTAGTTVTFTLHDSTYRAFTTHPDAS